MARTSKSVVIVGGGISGLSAAFALLEQAEASAVPITCTVLEAAPVWGGKILTHRVGERVMEAGPDSFLSKKPWGMDLCRRLGLTDQLIGTNPAEKKASVLWQGRLHELPEGLVTFTPTQLGPFFRSGLLSWLDLARMGCDIAIPPRRSSDDGSIRAAAHKANSWLCVPESSPRDTKIPRAAMPRITSTIDVSAPTRAGSRAGATGTKSLCMTRRPSTRSPAVT